MTFHIREDNLTGPQIIALLEGHLNNMREISPPESIHALDLVGLRAHDVAFWTVWEGETLLGCGALKTLSETHGEIKSMRTTIAHRDRGVGTFVLRHIIDESRRRGFERISLETGSQPAFEPARALYRKHGFALCEPFADYTNDPNSVFMTRAI